MLQGQGDHELFVCFTKSLVPVQRNECSDIIQYHLQKPELPLMLLIYGVFRLATEMAHHFLYSHALWVVMLADLEELSGLYLQITVFLRQNITQFLPWRNNIKYKYCKRDLGLSEVTNWSWTGSVLLWQPLHAVLLAWKLLTSHSEMYCYSCISRYNTSHLKWFHNL